jgi:hypothetical protein
LALLLPICLSHLVVGFVKRSGDSSLAARDQAMKLATALGLALAAAGCSSTVADSIPNWAGGIPENAPHRLAAEMQYPPVNERPPARDTKVVTVEEQAKIEKELAAAREVQAKQAAQVKKDRDAMIANTPKPNAAPPSQ